MGGWIEPITLAPPSIGGEVATEGGAMIGVGQ